MEQPQSNLIICAMCNDGTAAVNHVTWGADKQQQGNLCKHHLTIVWEWCEPFIAAGTCWWSQSEPTIV
jgi:hypothetical protein